MVAVLCCNVSELLLSGMDLKKMLIPNSQLSRPDLERNGGVRFAEKTSQNTVSADLL